MQRCNIIGSNKGTSKDPKFSLKPLFWNTIFKMVEALVEAPGPYTEGSRKLL